MLNNTPVLVLPISMMEESAHLEDRRFFDVLLTVYQSLDQIGMGSLTLRYGIVSRDNAIP